jgi:small subunit ribosomal protein S21
MSQIFLSLIIKTINRKETVLTQVHIRNNESQQQLLSRFRKKVIRSKILSEVRKRRWFISKNEQRRIDKKKATRRIQQKRQRRYG